MVTPAGQSVNGKSPTPEQLELIESHVAALRAAATATTTAALEARAQARAELAKFQRPRRKRGGRQRGTCAGRNSEQREEDAAEEEENEVEAFCDPYCLRQHNSLGKLSAR